MRSLRLFLRCALHRATVLRALGVATVITPVLIAVNLWEQIAGGALDGRFAAKVALTFCVPYLVSTYSSARAEALQSQEDEPAAEPARSDRTARPG